MSKLIGSLVHSVTDPLKGIRGVYGCIASLIDSSISSNRSALPLISLNTSNKYGIDSELVYLSNTPFFAIPIL